MLINSMLYPNFTLIPLLVGNNDTERVSTYKIAAFLWRMIYTWCILSAAVDIRI